MASGTAAIAGAAADSVTSDGTNTVESYVSDMVVPQARQPEGASGLVVVGGGV